MKDVVIPNSVTSIGYYAFINCSSLISVTIPNSVTSIGSSAFSGCNGLTSVIIPNSVTSIGSDAFYGCKGLTSITIPNSAKSIGGYTFYGCSSLSSVTIPNSVTSIRNTVFYNCSNLKSVTIPNSVTSIGNSAFYGCSGLTSVVIGNSVTSIGSDAFYGCTGLASITLNTNYIVSKEDYTSSSNLGTIFGSQVKEYILGDDVKSIGGSAFHGCGGLTSITIPNSVTSIRKDAFRNCGGLTKAEFGSIESLCNIEFLGSDANPLYYAKHLYINGHEVKDVVIPNCVTSIGYYAFEGCSSLTSVTIPNSVTSIGKYAFYGCSGLTSVTCRAEDVPMTNTNAFSNQANATLYVPASALEDYKNTAPWSSFGTIVALKPSYIVGDANGNGEVEIGDVTSVLTLMATPEVTGYNNEAADANGNGVIEIGDVTTILTIMAKGE